MSRPLVLIAAVGRNGAIGRRNGLPWRLAGDMAHFRAATMGKPLIVGRRTWESIGRPLPGRAMLVVSRDPALPLPNGVLLCRDPAEAVARAGSLADSMGAEAVMAGGGAALYASLIGAADRLEITEVDLAPEADAVFPPIDGALWRETARAPAIPGRATMRLRLRHLRAALNRAEPGGSIAAGHGLNYMTMRRRLADRED